jgi:hypothetical protein
MSGVLNMKAMFQSSFRNVNNLSRIKIDFENANLENVKTAESMF